MLYRVLNHRLYTTFVEFYVFLEGFELAHIEKISLSRGALKGAVTLPPRDSGALKGPDPNFMLMCICAHV